MPLVVVLASIGKNIAVLNHLCKSKTILPRASVEKCMS